jgi:Na+:H+ antiporter, NhaA family
MLLAMKAEQRRGRGGALREFLQTEASSGIVLVFATVVALVWANLNRWSYARIWTQPFTLGPVANGITLDRRGWINEALMTVFFLVVGLEIKRELVDGELKDRRIAALPIWAAAGGMAVPAIIYALINAGSGTARGWAIPMATDIAMAVGVLALFGNRVPNSVKIFLLALAIVDDIGSVLVIAVFYGHAISMVWLGLAIATLGIIVILKSIGVRTLWVYGVFGLGLWLALLYSGVHPTLAGVACGLLAPTNVKHNGESIVEWLEHRLVPISSFVVVPLFALANAGVPIGVDAFRDVVSSRLGAGIILGLVCGKPLGIVVFALLAVKLRAARLPEDATWPSVIGVAALGGMGFTVSLFIAGLAFTGRDSGGALAAQARLAVLVGTLVSGVIGAGLLKKTRNPSRAG